MRIALTVFCSLFCLDLLAQVELERSVLAVSGASVNLGASTVSFTLGEAVIQTLVDTETTLTQGFQQPSSKGSIVFDLTITEATCATASNGRAEVSNILGCDAPYNVLWSDGQTGDVAFDLAPGFYQVQITSPSCQTTADFAIGVDSASSCELKFFNAFSPNGDGINEVWEIENIERPEFSDNAIKIFNRWGQPIFEISKYNNLDRSWDGTDTAGNELASATYFYVATINGRDFTGYIELTR